MNLTSRKKVGQLSIRCDYKYWLKADVDHPVFKKKAVWGSNLGHQSRHGLNSFFQKLWVVLLWWLLSKYSTRTVDEILSHKTQILGYFFSVNQWGLIYFLHFMHICEKKKLYSNIQNGHFQFSMVFFNSFDSWKNLQL